MGINWAKLGEHFPVSEVDFKPQTFSKDRTKALAIAFVDPRAYQRRLDEVVGVANWSVEYRPLGETVVVTTTKSEDGTTKHRHNGAVICRLTITDGDRTVVREEVGEFDGTGNSAYPTASAQAFKRACTAFGLGRYLYDLPQTWALVEYNKIKDEEIQRMRQALAKLAPKATESAPAQAKGGNTPAPAPAPAKGQNGVNQAKAMSRLAELIGEARELDIPMDFIPKNWQSLPYEELVAIGQKLATLIADAEPTDD